MTKYICNAWHAVKVSFANEVGTLVRNCVDAESLARDLHGRHQAEHFSSYLKPALLSAALASPRISAPELSRQGTRPGLAALPIDHAQQRGTLERAVEMVLETGKKKIALLGLSFKARTDDLRESPQVQLAKRLLGEGRDLKIWTTTFARPLIGSNRQYMRRSSRISVPLLCPDLETASRKRKSCDRHRAASTRDSKPPNPPRPDRHRSGESGKIAPYREQWLLRGDLLVTRDEDSLVKPGKLLPLDSGGQACERTTFCATSPLPRTHLPLLLRRPAR